MEDKIELIDNSILRHIRDIKPMQIKDQKSGVTHTVLYSGTLGASSVGSDYHEENSFYKARSELIERLVFNEFKNKISSTSGLSAHLNDVDAKSNSFKELVERDLFLTSWFSGDFPAWDNLLIHKFPFDKFDKNLEIKIGYIGNCNELRCFVYIILDKDKRFGSICGAVCEKTDSELINKIIFDISRIQLLSKGKMNLTTIHDNTPLYHFYYYLNPDSEYIRNTYTKNSSSPINLNLRQYNFTLFKFKKNTLFPISVALCASEEVQTYFSGEATLDRVNKKRVPNLIHPNRIIHPLG